MFVLLPLYFQGFRFSILSTACTKPQALPLCAGDSIQISLYFCLMSEVKGCSSCSRVFR